MFSSLVFTNEVVHIRQGIGVVHWNFLTIQAFMNKNNLYVLKGTLMQI